MAIQRWEHEAMNSRIVPDDVGNYVLYTDHLAECREREKAAALSMAEWVLERYMDQKSIGSWEIEAEASHRYGEGRGK